MDYDTSRQPDVYDAGRSYAPSVLQFWLATIARSVNRHAISRILDLGCGTGRYSAALAEHFGADVVAADPSRRMLTAARHKRAPRVRYVEAAAELLPFERQAFDLVFLSMVFHHFRDCARALRECRRVLRRSGVVCLRAGTSDEIGRCPYAAFFPMVGHLLSAELKSRAEHKRLFSEAGFDLASHEVVRSEVASDWSAYAERVALRADSMLERLSEEAFRDGLAALRRHAADRGAEPVYEFVDLFTFRPSAAMRPEALR